MDTNLDQRRYFQKWLTSLPHTFNFEEIDSVVGFFEKHHEAVEKWCKERNLTCHVNDNTTGPSMLPYSSFLWQWAAQMCHVKAMESSDVIMDNDSSSYEPSNKIKLPINPRVRSELCECWQSILGYQYHPFPF